MDIKKIKENKLGMIMGFSIPSVIAMLLETIITITDGYFTGNYVGENALAAINLGLPILYLFLGIGLCVGVGGSVICGRLLGGRQNRKASEVFSQTMVTSFGVCLVVSLVVFALFGPILKVLRAEGALADYFTEYYMIMLFAYPLMVAKTILGMFIRADGKPQLCMAVNIAACLLNMLLDYLLVAVFGLGIRGSAIATLIVQIVTAAIMSVYFMSNKAGIKFTGFKFDREINRETMLNGSSEFIGEIASAVSMFAFNYVLMKYVGAEGVAAFTILGYVVYGYSMICIGFGQGIMPLVSFCWGADEKETASDIRRLTNGILIVLGLVTATSFFLTGRGYAEAFGCSSQVADMVGGGFKIYGITFLVMGYDVINSMYFTSCGDAKSSAIISALRGIVLLLGFTLILPAVFGMTGVWMAAPCTEILTAIVSSGLLLRQGQSLKTDYQTVNSQTI